MITLLLILSASAGGPTARDAGFTMLQNFQCDNKGDVTQRVMDSIRRTKSIVKQIGETEKACQAVSQQISQLPDISNITKGIRTNNIVNQINEQEGLINEALADMSFVSSLTANDPQLSLYPSLKELNGIVQIARSELITLRVQLKVEQANIEQNNLISGITELDSIAQGYAAALRGSDECFKKRPDLKQHLTTGIVGIAGFFLNSPLGIGTSLAGRLMQNIFDIKNASRNRIQESFSAADQTAIALGLGCAFEQFGKQHCRILREKRLFSSLHAKGESCAEVSEVEGILEKQKNLFEALKKIEDWSNKTGIATADDNSVALRESAKSQSKQMTSQMKQDIMAAVSSAKASQTFN
ncbi:MAG: hypothetical protein KA715_08985 [Xanthomonadaceae bacterium]|nr:hypothetical protein [Xanthomonadaceae bacterium]